MVESGNTNRSEMAPQIVFVDDDAEVLEEYAELLEIFGHCAATYTSPTEALGRVIADECIKVVVTDFRMPVLDGAGLVQAIRARLPATRSVGFIILTGMGAGFRPEGAEGIPTLSKPFDFKQLLDLMQPYLG